MSQAANDYLLKLQREHREQRRYLKDLTASVSLYLKELDVVMKGPATPERGERVALLSNRLNMANDLARHFGLGEKLTRGASQ